MTFFEDPTPDVPQETVERIMIYHQTFGWRWKAYYDDEEVANGETWTHRGARRQAKRALKYYRKNGVQSHAY